MSRTNVFRVGVIDTRFIETTAPTDLHPDFFCLETSNFYNFSLPNTNLLPTYINPHSLLMRDGGEMYSRPRRVYTYHYIHTYYTFRGGRSGAGLCDNLTATLNKSWDFYASSVAVNRAVTE